jgi:hypothetical protein
MVVITYNQKHIIIFEKLIYIHFVLSILNDYCTNLMSVSSILKFNFNITNVGVDD